MSWITGFWAIGFRESAPAGSDDPRPLTTITATGAFLFFSSCWSGSSYGLAEAAVGGIGVSGVGVLAAPESLVSGIAPVAPSVSTAGATSAMPLTALTTSTPNWCALV